MSEEPFFSALMHPRHLKTVRTLSYVLTQKTREAWQHLVPILMGYLTTEERVALSFMTLKSLDRDDAIKTAEAVLCTGAGQPLAPLFSFADEAASWVSMAEPKEVEVYCLTTFDAMPPDRQAAFFEYVQKRSAA